MFTIKNVFRKLNDFLVGLIPHENTIRHLVKRLETGFVQNIATPLRARLDCLAENIIAVGESVVENSRISIIRRSQQLGIAQTTTWRILTKELTLHAYKIQLTQESKP